MNSKFTVLIGGLVFAATVSASGQGEPHAHPVAGPAAPASSESGIPDPDATLAREARLETILAVAQRANPEIRMTQERTRAALARAGAAGRLPDLDLKYEQWGVPLSRPYALDEASTLMVGLRQTLPPPGSLGAREHAAEQDAHVLAQEVRAREQDVRVRVKRAFFDYYSADRNYRIHLEHVGLESRIVVLARQNYQVGKASQQDVLRAVVDLSRLHTDVADIEQQLASSKALLNALMARPVAAPIGPPAEVSPMLVSVTMEQAERLLQERRPELLSAQFAIQRSEANLTSARAEARLPSVMLGADYWYQPTSQVRHAYAAMVSINLPWFNGRYREQVRAAEAELAADLRARDSIRNTTAYELRDALARAQAAQQSFGIINGDLLPQSRQSFEAAQAAFAAGQGDALGLLDSARSYLQVRLEHARALARLGSSLADLERTIGADPSNATSAAQEQEK